MRRFKNPNTKLYNRMIIYIFLLKIFLQNKYLETVEIMKFDKNIVQILKYSFQKYIDIQFLWNWLCLSIISEVF